MTRGTNALLLATAALLLSACATVTSTSQPIELAWQQRTPAVAELTFSPLKDSVVHALRVDLQAHGVQVLMSPPVERGQVLTDMATAVESLAAVNGSFFSKEYVPRGLTVSNGETWFPIIEQQSSPMLACDGRPRCVVVAHPPFELKPEWKTVVSGTPWLIDDGRLRTPADDATCAHLCAMAHPRTAVGVDASGRYLYLVTSEGRRPPVLGLTLTQLSAVMQQLGARNAVNLDGGGSSTMMFQGKPLLARPLNEPEPRPVANALLVRELPMIEAAPTR